MLRSAPGRCLRRGIPVQLSNILGHSRMQMIEQT
jgi:hypothetical protein